MVVESGFRFHQLTFGDGECEYRDPRNFSFGWLALAFLGCVAVVLCYGFERIIRAVGGNEAREVRGREHTEASIKFPFGRS